MTESKLRELADYLKGHVGGLESENWYLKRAQDILNMLSLAEMEEYAFKVREDSEFWRKQAVGFQHAMLRDTATIKNLQARIKKLEEK